MDIVILLARLGLAAAHGAKLAGQLGAIPVGTEVSEATLTLMVQEIQAAIGMAQQALQPKEEPMGPDDTQFALPGVKT